MNDIPVFKIDDVSVNTKDKTVAFSVTYLTQNVEEWLRMQEIVEHMQRSTENMSDVEVQNGQD